MSEIEEQIQEAVENGKESRFNAFIALFVAVMATFMALCNVKDGNVVQAMQQAQAKSIDQWSYYQAKGTKEHIAENTAELLQAQLDIANGLKTQQMEMLESKIYKQKALVKKYEEEKNQIRKEAEQASRDYDALNVHDDQFDLAEACLSTAIALAGITVLTKKRWLFALAGGLGALGFLFGLAGFLHWQLHSDLMSKLLG